MNERSSTPTEDPTADSSVGRGSAERSSLQRVLLVTDRARERHVLMSALETLPVATAFASSRYDALRLAETLRPDVIVVDAELRGDEGWAICEELLKSDDAGIDGMRWRPSFILLHGERNDTPERAKTLGLDQLLRWPFAVDEARSLLEVHLSEPGYGSGGYSTEEVVEEEPGLDEPPTDSASATERWMASPVNEAETPVQGWPPLEMGPTEDDEAVDGSAEPSDLVDALPAPDADGDARSAAEGDGDEPLDEPGDAHAAIAMLEPNPGPERAAGSSQTDDDPPSGSLALFPGVQPPPSSPPPIANLFAILDDDAPAGQSSLGEASDGDEATDPRGERPGLEGAPFEEGTTATESALGEEAPEFVDVVEDDERATAASTAPDGEEEAGAEMAPDDPSDDLLAASPPTMDLPPLTPPLPSLSDAKPVSEDLASDDRLPAAEAAEDTGDAEEAEDAEDADGTESVEPEGERPDDGEAGDAEPIGLLSLDADLDETEPDETEPDETEPDGTQPEETELTETGPTDAELEAIASGAVLTGASELGDESEGTEDPARQDVESEVVSESVEVDPGAASERAVLVEEDLGEEIFVMSPPREGAGDATPEPAPVAAARPSIAPTLADLFNADGVTQVLLLERGGGVVFTSSKTPQLSMSQLAQHSLELFACADLVLGATDTGREGVTDALVAEGPSGCVLLQSVDDHFLVVCVDKNSGLGQVRFLVRRVLEPLREVLAEG